MVKHGRNKKRRAGRIGRTKLKNRTYRRWDPNPKFTDATIRKNWDPSKSPAMNLSNLGLLARPNQDIQRANDAQQLQTNNDVNVVELFDVPDSDELRKAKQQRRLPLKEEDQKYIARCMAKHGDNYLSMFRDTKTNFMQHTETQLRKMGSRFLLLSAEQRKVDVPEKVKALAQN